MASNLLPVVSYGLEIRPGEIVPVAAEEFDGPQPNYRFTMAAIDPSAPGSVLDVPQRSILKICRQTVQLDSDDDEDYDEEDFRALMELEDDSDEEGGAGPSDPSKSPKKGSIKELLAAVARKDEDEDDDIDMEESLPNGKPKRKSKGKGRASDDDSEEEDDDDEEDDDEELEKFVVCTLDAEKNYQQPVDITVPDAEHVFFQNVGTHTIYLTGNIVIDTSRDLDDESDDDEDLEDEYDLTPDEDELELDDESDELDDIADPRITEIDESEEEIVEVAPKKAKSKKRAAEEEPETLDEIIEKAAESAMANADAEKLSKKQLKKLKKNNGEAVVAASTPETQVKTDKRVKFAKVLEETAPPPKKEVKKEDKKADAKPAPNGVEKKGKSIRVVEGVKIEDSKTGKGPTAKKGSRVEMRYIGKLENGKVFDSNKSGKPFSFKLGVGEVIKGWDIGVAGIAVGGERRLTIPASKAYGSKGVPGIPGNSTLIFDIKCLGVH